jgi:hypothetical protein
LQDKLLLALSKETFFIKALYGFQEVFRKESHETLAAISVERGKSQDVQNTCSQSLLASLLA